MWGLFWLGEGVAAPFICEEGGGFDAGDFERAAAFFAGDFVVEEHHVAGGFGEFGAVAFVGVAGEGCYFAAFEPAELVFFNGPAKVAVEFGWLGYLRFAVKGFFVH